jgi:prolyl 4-hydroxylase
MSSNPVEAAYRNVAAGRVADALALLEAAGAANDAVALAELAVWYLRGTPVQRDLARARAILRRAVTIGHVDAALIEIALTANGSGAPPDWGAAYGLLRAAAAGDPVAAGQLKLLKTMAIDGKGNPIALPKPEVLAAGSKILRFPRLFTPEECAHVAGAVSDALEPASVVDPRTGRRVLHPVRIADEAVIGTTREDLVIQALNRRIAAVSDTSTEQGEALTVLRYRRGQRFQLHSDILSNTRNQRSATLIVYLNAGFEGGNTVFPAHGLDIVPRAGDAILFRNVDASGIPDASMRHSGEPVVRGVKWLATRWIRERPFSPWNGPEN